MENSTIDNQENEQQIKQDAPIFKETQEEKTPASTHDDYEPIPKSPMITGSAFDPSKEQDMDDMVHQQQEDGSLPDPESLSMDEDAETHNDLSSK